MNDATYGPVSESTASVIVSASTVRSIIPRIRRTSGPNRYATRPEGAISRNSSDTNPVGAFHARWTTNGRARPGCATRYTPAGASAPCPW